eukprot:TRINITY_DN7880_c0_g1_i3.p1 TRINITY_DN7880_c0_g1~~TRINITY_DN7880_c0_g1_i3.p1  ORF type:complete len:300 (-),score=65.43 TRINITY_DN7880_c0_g1_i3:370-1269(-)
MRAFLLLQLAICATALPAYFGFWGADLSETSEFTNLQFGPNATELVAGFRNGVKGLYAMRDVLYEGNKLRKDYQDRLAAAVPEVKALLENGTIIGIFMGDELIWNCMSDEDLHQGVDAVRAAFPRENGTIIWQNEAAMRPPTYTDHCGRPHLSYKIPEGLDWYSVDIYHMDGASNGWVNNQVEGYYNKFIFPNLTANQRVAVVPGFFGSDVNHFPNGTYVCNRTCYDAMCALDAGGFWSWAQRDERVAAIFPWNWNGCPTCNGSHWTPPHTCCMDEIGGRDMQRARAAWTQIGKSISRK